MTHEQVEQPRFLPRVLSLPGRSFLFAGQSITLSLSTGFEVFVGPNGAGKSEMLRWLRDRLRGDDRPPLERKVVYLAAGRNSQFEQFRSKSGVGGPNYRNETPAALGAQTWGSDWWHFEGNIGMILRLKERPDLLLKVQARLQALYQRTLRLDWSQSGLQIGLYHTQGGALYYANAEASGILELIPLLAAIYDDEIGALLIDEPEISLHPQLQAFLLQEVQACAGDPSDPQKKLIVVATHSPTMLPIRRISDIPKLTFFLDQHSAPIQIDANASELKNGKLGALIARLSENHKLAFFARRVLLVEGPSDEIVVSGLALRFDHPLLGANTQVVPVTGKGQFAETVKFFRLMGKDVFVLADLDGLVDDNGLVNVFSKVAQDAANRRGMGSILEIDRSIRDRLQTLIENAFEALSPATKNHSYWTNRKQDEALKAKRRATLAVLLTTSEADFEKTMSEELVPLRKRYDALLDVLSEAGCVILRRGTIEDYYWDNSKTTIGKPETAALEVENFSLQNPQAVRYRYSDVTRALEMAAPVKQIDENRLLREQLGALLGAALQIVTPEMPDDELNSRVATSSAYQEPIFHFTNRSSVKDGHPNREVGISIASQLFRRDGFPCSISEHENPTVMIARLLPS